MEYCIPKQFSLKFLFGLMLVAAIFAAFAARYAHFAPRRLPVTEIECTQPWSEVTEHNKTVVFVDCDANKIRYYHSNLYEPYCRWYRWKYGRNAVLVNTMPGSGETWDVLQQTWKDRNMHMLGYKAYGGAGQVVWIVNGTVVDIAFLPDFTDLHSMKQRTLKNFR